ncbi:nickel/cobalt transporter [Actinoplanes sp. CA-030573]|uniref:nickel/cobalt transporter n=1 Tax=Actinoplanes sp. CA-030573 TaxID=3239898 RepID=UPI003D8E78DD
MNPLRIGAALLVTGIALLATGTPAEAHPLGNFTTNQYAGLRVTSEGVDVDYVLDLAELPAYQAKHDEIDTDGDGRDSRQELDAYTAGTCRSVVAATTVRFDGQDVPVRGGPSGLSFPPGAGGLTTLRLQCALHADGTIRDGTDIAFEQSYLADRIGWREITAVGDRYTLTSSSVPARSVSARLTAYPPGAPTQDVRAAALTVRHGGPPAPMFAGEQNLAVQARGVDRFTRWFTELIGHPQLTWGVGVLAVLVAFVLGGAHAAAPGHGKTIMAAYLVGARGRISHALTVAATVAATHTAGVLVLGVILATSLQLAPEHLYEWLRLASGVLVALVGAQLLRRALANARRRAAAPDSGGLLHPGDHNHAHAHSGAPGHDHVHAHAHAHADNHRHSHRHDHASGEVHSHGGVPHTHALPPADEPFHMRTVLAMGFAGGLSPSPSAVVVLLGAAALGRAWYGVLLVLTYGIGLATVLTGIGLALARWGHHLRRAGSGRFAGVLTHRLPTATAAAILIVGVGIAAYSVNNLYLNAR